MHFVACTNKKYFPDPKLVTYCEDVASRTGGTITLTEDAMEGTRGADIVYTDVWVSMGEPEEVWKERITDLMPYQVNKKLMDNAGRAGIVYALSPGHSMTLRPGLDRMSMRNSDTPSWK